MYWQIFLFTVKLPLCISECDLNRNANCLCLNEMRKILFILGATQYEVNKNEIIQTAVEIGEIRTKKI